MFLTDSTRSQLVLSLLSWGVVLALYGVTRWRGGSMSAEEVESKKAAPSGRAAERILVLANQTLVGE
jgi:GABA permease